MDAPEMNLSMLLEDALTARGNTVAVIARPEAGETAAISIANAPFAHILGWPVDGAAGRRVADLRPLIEHSEHWDALIAALRALSPLTLDMKLRVAGREVWWGFNLTFQTARGETEAHGILIGRDITETRERAIRASEMQRLLASVFLRTSAAVTIVGGDGAILMANPAAQQLLGFGSSAMAGVNVETLTAPEFAEASRLARSRQLSDGEPYVMRIEAIAQDGRRVAVTLHSALLRDARDRRLRVVTLVPFAATPDHSGTDIYSDDPDYQDDGDEEAASRSTAKALLRRLRGHAAADVRSVSGRDGVVRPLLLLDFVPHVRTRLFELGPTLRDEPDLGTTFDLLRLDLATRELAAQKREASVIVPISWTALADEESRLAVDRRLAKLRPDSQSRIQFVVSGIPRFLSRERWTKVVSVLQHQLGEVGLLFAHRDADIETLQDAITSGWPLSLLVIDRADGQAVELGEYRGLIATARRREMSVMVRTTAEVDIPEWRKIGATMFVTTS
jgi:PAS domain S-box-containing protein